LILAPLMQTGILAQRRRIFSASRGGSEELRRRFEPAVLRQSRAYDLAMRAPVLAYALCLAVFAASRLLHCPRPAGAAAGAGCIVTLAMQLADVAYLVVLAASVVIRLPPRRRAAGAEPRISALVGTFLIPAVVLFPRRELSCAGEMIATLLLLAGNSLALGVLVRLGRSFSIMAEARRVVTTGAYRWVRHPLYLAEELAVFGLVLQFLSPWTVLRLGVQIAFQLRRMVNEERVLGAAFPEYAVYRQGTAMLLPGIC
jgi:protein-S-isoprenylcysteine O-methyltransferase Ste14